MHGLLDYLCHHVFLPPKLPQSDDENPKYEALLLDTVIEALQQFGDLASADQRSTIFSVLATLKTVKRVHSDGVVNEGNLQAALATLGQQDCKICLHIRAQNAAVIISKVDQNVHFEAFELSPTNEQVMRTKGRLRRTFPGRAVAVQDSMFQQPQFQATIAATLARMSQQAAVDTKPKVRKAGQMHEEERDTTHPKVITELLMAVLCSKGEPLDVPLLSKNTREDVLWLDSLLPWRRSPWWLLLRVTMQLSFARLATPTIQDWYKPFMVYLMAHIADRFISTPLSSNVAHTLRAKIGRRCLKLQPDVSWPQSGYVHTVMAKLVTTLDQTRSQIIQRTSSTLEFKCLETLNFEQDTIHTLPRLDEFLVSANNKEDGAKTTFQPQTHLVQHATQTLPSSAIFEDNDDLPYNLLSFEHWVAFSLDWWLESRKTKPETCGAICDLITEYHTIARQSYKNNPEAMSVMMLTILELWIACDKSAVTVHQLLEDFDPGMPLKSFGSLLLPSKEQMERLHCAEEYLLQRRQSAKSRDGGVFRDFGTETCFSVRFYEQSAQHQDLLARIEHQAQQDRLQKSQELQRKKDRYDALMQQYDQSSCEYVEVVVDRINDFREDRHSANCRRCGYKSEAESLTIHVHEWPLPKCALQKQSTVFELKVPVAFARWRDISLYVLLEVFSNRYSVTKVPRNMYHLQTYKALSGFFVRIHAMSRIRLSSQTKPHAVTHRQAKVVYRSCESDICLNNGLRYQYLDDVAGVFVANIEETDKILQLTTYHLPTTALQRYLFRPSSIPSGPPPNTVLARQCECPIDMSIEEFRALGGIPLGFRLAWQNILRELWSSSIDFRKLDTSMIVLQCIYQAGPQSGSSALRASHETVDNDQFTYPFLSGLGEALERTKENWESSSALSTFISMAARILSLTSSEKTQDQCLSFLNEARGVAMNWMNTLEQKHTEADLDERRSFFASKAIEAALICVDSFNVDRQHLENLLSEAAAIFIRCSIFIHERLIDVSAECDMFIVLLRRRWEKLSYSVCPILADRVLETKHNFLDDAMKKSWSAYEPGKGWHQALPGAEHWLATETTLRGSSDALLVHVNLLTGELLVNGLPLCRLPPNYEKHPLYRTLFGHSWLEVMPTSVPGMKFSAKLPYAGYDLQFGIKVIAGSGSQTPCDLLIQSIKDGKKHLLIPSRLFHGDLPVAFVDEYVHWYDMSEGSVELRPIRDAWTISPDHWKLTRSHKDSNWQLSRGNTSLVSVHSTTAKALSAPLIPLDDLLRMHVTLDRSSGTVEIEMVRHQLKFYVLPHERSIRSKQYRGMVIDQDQNVGTLFGLQNKLILRSEHQGSRLLLLPEGPVSYIKDNELVRVSIDKDLVTRIPAYNIDELLGKLVDDGSLQSKLFLCYLHGLTSMCMSDPLTGRTGTEQALSILQLAAVRSFDTLTPENLNLLSCIAKLSPKRRHYPQNERVMQSVAWDTDLSCLAQHGRFSQYVSEICEHADRMSIFTKSPGIKISLPAVERDLVEQDAIRSSNFRACGFGAEDHTIERDMSYQCRDKGSDSAQGCNAFRISLLLHKSPKTLQFPVEEDIKDRLWKFLQRNHEILGATESILLSDFSYDAKWLQNSSKYLSQNWCRIQKTFCDHSASLNKFSLVMWFSTLAFATGNDMQVIQTLASFFVFSKDLGQHIPRGHSFALTKGATAKHAKLREILRSSVLPFSQSPDSRLTAGQEESAKRLKERQRQAFQKNQSTALDHFSNQLTAQWPCEHPKQPTDTISVSNEAYLDFGKAMIPVRSMFECWYRNRNFEQYLDHITKYLLCQTVESRRMPSFSERHAEYTNGNKRTYISVDDLFAGAAPYLRSSSPVLSLDVLRSSERASHCPGRFVDFLGRLEAQATSKFETEFGDDLREGFDSLQQNRDLLVLSLCGDDIEALRAYLNCCNKHVEYTWDAIASAVSTEIISTFGLAMPSPQVTPMLLLTQLNRNRWKKLSDNWKRSIVDYAISLVYLQRAKRLLTLTEKPAELATELQNTGHRNWNPLDDPEALLLEVESGILIRDNQAQIATKMRNPPSQRNATMQLNMGEGKSSVIVPWVAAALADGKQLVRVIVSKAQSVQMFNMLVSKLGGLLNRKVYRMPFFRGLNIGDNEARLIKDICLECMKSGAILLVQPEHLLSLKLMGLDCLISGKTSVGRYLRAVQSFFDASSRDIVDESDEVFNVKFELIYTMGTQQPIDLSPERWVCIQEILQFVKRVAPVVQQEYPQSIEVHDHGIGRFPRLRLYGVEAQQRFLECVAEEVRLRGLHGLPIARQPDHVKQAVIKYMTEIDLNEEEVAMVEDRTPGGFWTDSTGAIVLLLRGLLAGGVLTFALTQKRWKVNYGLDFTRSPATKLAVPYRAKDSPTLRSEFSHPDVVIVLTCLSYYYGGLGDDDLFMAFGHLLKSDQADIEYQSWVRDAPGLPYAFRQLQGISLKDRSQCTKSVFPELRWAKSTIDYFLTNIVFPKELKEFPSKLSLSGWDLGEVKALPTTAFSGTNDSRKTLPLSMDHLDLPEQRHTNALVIEFLLQPENFVTLIPTPESRQESDASVLLNLVVKLKLRVILDVGAQILELDNEGVAREWLRMTEGDESMQAVVFFDNNDELFVLDRTGRQEPLQTSPFMRQLNVCLVFLDQVHIRGTDLKLPEDYRAAVTLGPNVTKDSMIQGCMRMRKLGKGQSVTFCIPHEIVTKILKRSGKSDGTSIDVKDVLSHAVSETCMDLQRSMPLWAAQGKRFESQLPKWDDLRNCHEDDLSKKMAEKFLEPESQSIQERYQPRCDIEPTLPETHDTTNQKLIAERCREFGQLHWNAANLQEEQERELSPEIEQERQVQRPAPAEPARHQLHPDLISFVRSGNLDRGSDAFMPAFQTLSNTTAATYLNVSQLPIDLLVSTDFARTVSAEKLSLLDGYQRPVHWILTSFDPNQSGIKYAEHVVIISPYEAQEILPEIQQSATVTVHLYAGRTNLGFKSLDKLDLFCTPARSHPIIIPRRLTILINLYAGQLYFDSFEEYVEVCDFLGLAWEPAEDDRVIAADGFIIQEPSGLSASAFAETSPVKFLRVLMTNTRRNCQGIDKTHMGRVLDGTLLHPSDFADP